jgi:site-specific DNA-methyltransferase (adenine-specific)/modification methylase
MLEINKIYQMDCLEGMKQMEDNSVNIVVTSPPYNVGGKYLGYKDKSGFCDYFIFIRNVLDELLRVTKTYTFFNFSILENNKETYLNILSNYRENVKEIFIWAKTKSGSWTLVNEKSHICGQLFEFIICFAERGRAKNRKFEVFNNPNISTVLFKPSIKQKENKIESIHNATFPLWLPEFFISSFSNEGDIVLDPFMGSGTTAVACKRLNRKFIGFDIQKEYVEYAMNRVKNVPAKLEQFKITDEEDIP